jgi:hypothetical protein
MVVTSRMADIAAVAVAIWLWARCTGDLALRVALGWPGKPGEIDPDLEI